MNVSHYPVFDNLRYVHIVGGVYSAFIDMVAMEGKKYCHAIKAMKLALLVMGMPWLLVTDSGPDYSSQQFSIFLFSCRISH